MIKRICLLTLTTAKAFCFFVIREGSVLAFVFACIHVRAAGQPTNPTNNVVRDSTIGYAIRQYQTSMGKAIQLYNGAEYIRPFPLIKGSPFLEERGLQKGRVYFDGILYPDAMLAYDVVNQQLVTTGYQNINLTLVPEKIGYFYLANRLFIPAPRDSITNKKPMNGFFEVLYNQTPMVLARYQKTPKRSTSSENANTYIQSTTYYILKDNTVFKVDNEKALLAVFKKQKENMKQYMRSNKLQFKKAPTETLLKTAAYFNQLNK